MALDADVLILGGGCAGLSLATALARHSPHLRVQILEARERYTRDRTWCFWNTEPHPFTAGVTHRWSNWRLRHAGVETRQSSKQFTYNHLPADCFYQLATEAIYRAGYTLSMGTEVRAVHQRSDCQEVETAKGTLRARWLFDSRPCRDEISQPILVQRFLGWHVRAVNACFDSSVVDLMDFQSSTDAGAVPGRTTFFYVLPFSPTEALVEATFLDDPVLPPADADAILRQHLERLRISCYEVLYTEAGALPMGGHTKGKTTSASRGHSVDIGTRGGRVKPSSGYAFLRIQRQSAALAKALGKGADLPTVFEGASYGLLDNIFLQALKREPERVPLYFMALFRQLSPDTLVRFLSETAGSAEVIRVMLALPKLDFLRAALFPAKELSA